MFTNKKDPLVDSVKAVMEENSIRRQVESLVNESFGVTSRKALPHELHAEYDAALEEAIKAALNEEDTNEPREKRKANPKAVKHNLAALGTVKRPDGSKMKYKKDGSKEELKEEELEEGLKGAIKSFGKSIATKIVKNKKYVAAQNMPGKDADQHAKRISHVQSLAKEEAEINESDEKKTRVLGKINSAMKKKAGDIAGKPNLGNLTGSDAQKNLGRMNQLASRKNKVENMKESFENFLRNKFFKD